MSTWRVDEKHPVHVYNFGNEPVATFHTVLDARRAVADHNTIDILDRLLRRIRDDTGLDKAELSSYGTELLAVALFKGDLSP